MQKAMKDVLTEEQKTLIKDNPHYMRVWFWIRYAQEIVIW